MIKILYSSLVTEHETTLEVAARLAACCTFFYAEQHKRAHVINGCTVVQLVWHPDARMWRLAEPGASIAVVETAIAYTIDGRKSEAQTQRAILGLIEEWCPLVNTNPMPTHAGQFVTEGMGRYMVLEIKDRRVRTRSEMSGTETWTNWDDSGYLDVRHAWRLI